MAQFKCKKCGFTHDQRNGMLAHVICHWSKIGLEDFFEEVAEPQAAPTEPPSVMQTDSGWWQCTRCKVSGPAPGDLEAHKCHPEQPSGAERPELVKLWAAPVRRMVDITKPMLQEVCESYELLEQQLAQADARIAELEAELAVERLRTEKFVQAEHRLSKAYIRLRELIPGAFDTPFAPTAEQVWAHTEACLKKLQAELAALREQGTFPRVPHERMGQSLFNFLEWLRLCGYRAEQSSRMADPFGISDEKFKSLWVEYAASLKRTPGKESQG